MKKLIIILAVLLTAGWAASAADAAIIVGRISHVEGEIYRYMDVDNSWVETHLQSPAGIEDVLSTGETSRAEIAFPNNLLLRLDENTAIDILELDEDLGVFVLNSGLARLYNRSSTGRLAIETARGTVKVAPGSVVDVQADGSSVVVAAVHGKATFQSLENGVEKLEVISGSTSLEFKAESIAAGVGPIDWKWDRWCADREGVWTQNSLVRSEYLPETMQGYAHVLKPHGNWRRVYYRGYNYWAWQPRHVAADWAPYTTGYWYDWQSGPVWIDHNPWGWVTDHHGHWIRMHGAWMWTPYVHVSNVPGVTVVGFNISFGRSYRPYWHPGRVRWISHSSHIGWLPLAPWETYYGYRRWGPRSVAVHGGASISININLAHHRYVDHAVVIPKRHFHKRGPAVVNNYNSVRIKNINKTVIVQNYKPVPTAEERRNRRHATKANRAGKSETRAVVQADRRKTRKREAARTEKQRSKAAPATQAQKRGPKERSAYSSRQSIAEKSTGAIGKRRDIISKEETPKRAVRAEQRNRVREKENHAKTVEKRGSVARKNPQGSDTIEASIERRGKGPRQPVAQTRNRTDRRQKNKTAARQNTAEDSKQVKKQTRVTQRRAQQNETPNKSNHKEKSRKYIENEKRQEAQQERQRARSQQSGGAQRISRKRQGDRQWAGRDFASASPNNRRSR